MKSNIKRGLYLKNLISKGREENDNVYGCVQIFWVSQMALFQQSFHGSL